MINPLCLVDLSIYYGQGQDPLVQAVNDNQTRIAEKMGEIIKVLNGSDELRTQVNIARYRSEK